MHLPASAAGAVAAHKHARRFILSANRNSTWHAADQLDLPITDYRQTPVTKVEQRLKTVTALTPFAKLPQRPVDPRC